MRSWQVYRQASAVSQPLRLERVDRQPLAPGELRIEVRCCAVCRTDLHVVEGDLPLLASPTTPGHQVVGRVLEVGSAATGHAVGERVGVAWLGGTCGHCRFCRHGRENLCPHAEFTGWSRPGGFAEEMVANAEFVYRLPEAFDDLTAAPLLCAGIIGYRALRLTGIECPAFAGLRLGIYGFGAAGHIAIQIARARGAEVYVATRGREHRQLADELGAAWVGDAGETPPAKLDAALLFAPAGTLVPAALAALDHGSTLVLGGIHMSPTPPLDYDLLWHERRIQSVANNTRDDGREFLAEAAAAKVRTHCQPFPFEQANDALASLAGDRIRGAAVLTMPGWSPTSARAAARQRDDAPGTVD